MDRDTILERIRRGRTDAVVELLRLPDWRDALDAEPYGPLQWCVYTDLEALLP